jgi:hypothetical protein
MPQNFELAKWLYARFGGDDFPSHWDELDTGQRIAWEETADDVIAAVLAKAAYEIVKR